MDISFFSNEKIEDIRLSTLTIKEIIDKYNFQLSDFNPYLPPKKKDLKKLDIQQRFLGYYLEWDPQECFYYASKNTGFKPNTERTEGSYSKYSSIDDKIDPFHYYCTFIKFGIGRATYDSSQEVRNGKITREEAAYLVKKYDSEFPKKYFKEFLKYIDIDEKNFWKTIDMFRSAHLWERDIKNDTWILKKSIAE